MCLLARRSSNRTRERLHSIYNEGVTERLGNQNTDKNRGHTKEFTRRDLIAAIAAVTADKVIPSSAVAQTVAHARLPENILTDAVIFKQRVAATERVYASPRVQAMLRHGSAHEVMDFMLNHTLDVNEQILASREFDIRAMQKKVVLVGYEETSEGKQFRTSSLSKADINDLLTLADAEQGRLAFGQAIPIDRTHVLLPKHVFDTFGGVAEVTGTPDLFYDVATARIRGQHYRHEQIARFAPGTDADINGRFVMITGVRPDGNLGRTGRKTLGGIAIQVTPPLYEFFAPALKTPQERRALQKSFIVISATHESRPVYNRQLGFEDTPVAGMSGAVFGTREERGFEERGFLWGGGQVILANGTEYSAFFLHGPDVVLPAIQKTLQHTPQRLEKTKSKI